MIELLNNLSNDNILQKLLRAGLISPTLINYMEIVNDYNEKIKRARVKRKMDIIQELSTKHKVSERTIYTALKTLR